MPAPPLRLWLLAGAAIVLLGWAALQSGTRAAPPAAGAALGPRYSAATLPAAAPLRFTPAVAPSDQQIVVAAIAQARPAARRLVERVEGLVTVSVGSPGPGLAGLTSSTADGYDVELNLGPVYRVNGMRGVRRLVLHELGHVVDHALVPVALENELDAATPAGFGCDDGGRSGACAARAERFAESFAKWATGDIGVDINLGYRVPPPTSLEHWGDPLAPLLTTSG
jgi:hypothetical protein